MRLLQTPGYPETPGYPGAVASGTDPGAIEADAFLTKPYEVDELCRVIARLSMRARAA